MQTFDSVFMSIAKKKTYISESENETSKPHLREVKEAHYETSLQTIVDGSGETRYYLVQNGERKEISKSKLDQILFNENSDGLNRIVVEKLSVDSFSKLHLFLKDSKQNQEESTKKIEHVEKDEDKNHNQTQFDSKKLYSLESRINEIVSEDESPSSMLYHLTYKKSDFQIDQDGVSNIVYLKAKNNHNLHRMGSYYLGLFEEGIEDFSFCRVSQGGETCTTTIVGLASFFDYHTSYHSLIITHEEGLEHYCGLLNIDDYFEINIKDIKARVYWEGRIFVVSISDIPPNVYSFKGSELGRYIKEYLGRSVVTFWDLPIIEVIEKNRDHFIPTFNAFDNITLIVTKNFDKGQQLQKTMEFFESYDVKTLGVVLGQSEEVIDE